MKKNILLTGLPCTGKTTLINEIVDILKVKKGGFYTSEIKESNKRIGFKIETYNGKTGLLAHVNFESPFKISKYGVNLKDLEEIAVNSILKAVKESDLIILDEIGKMELFSEQFKKSVWKALESDKTTIATIKVKNDVFTDKIKKRKDTRIFNVTKENREEIKREILLMLSTGVNGTYQ